MDKSELKKYGDEISSFLSIEFTKMEEELDDGCIDNYRVCEIGNHEEEKEYSDQQESGCCGTEDREIVHKATQRKFMIGCNYGH